MKIAVSTGGGDAPGLNAVIRAVTLAGIERGDEVWGIRYGYRGLLDHGPDGLIRLDRTRVRGIAHLGGTILGAASRGNPFKFPASLEVGGSDAFSDRSGELVDRVRKEGIDAVVAIGGDGSMAIANGLAQCGLPRIIGVPKTIDNDVCGTDVTFGFDTAVSIAMEAIDRLHTTAESHDRVLVVEVMGRHAGFIALRAGLAGGADVILIPEIPFRVESVAAKVRQRDARGRRFTIVVVAEGAMERGQEVSIKSTHDPFHAPVLGGIAERLSVKLGERTGKSTRSIVLGHLQRGGSPTSYDRVLGLRFGVAAVRALAAGERQGMVAMRSGRIELIALSEAMGTKTVPLDSDPIASARAIGICFGDEEPAHFDKS
jgi:6-phosphofructokinase 1